MFCMSDLWFLCCTIVHALSTYTLMYVWIMLYCSPEVALLLAAEARLQANIFRRSKSYVYMPMLPSYSCLCVCHCPVCFHLLAYAITYLTLTHTAAFSCKMLS